MKKQFLTITISSVFLIVPITSFAQSDDGIGKPLVVAPKAPDIEPVRVTANDSGEAQSATANVIEEVMVTARRTEESLQDVPVAITAMSNDDLQRESIGSAQDLVGKVPSLVIGAAQTMRNTQSPTIRGQGANLTGGAGVIMYFNEVPLPPDSFSNAQGGPGMFFDLQNLQVLKGPQGTLFGRNTTGGALLLEPAQPADDFYARVQIEKGNYELDGLEGIVNLPLIEDQLLLRVSAKKYHRDGFTVDVATGRDYDDKHYDHYRWGLLWRPTDTLENYLSGYKTEVDQNGTGNIIDSFNIEALGGLGPGILGVDEDDFLNLLNLTSVEVGCLIYALMLEADLSNLASLPAAIQNSQCGDDVIAEQKQRGIRRVQLSAHPINRTNIQSYINKTSWQFADTLELRNILSYTTYQRNFRWDQDGSRAVLNDTITEVRSSDTSTTTEEIQLQGTAFDDQLKFVVGYYWERWEPEGIQQNLAEVFGGFKFVLQEYFVERDSYGPYAQGTYNFAAVADRLEPMNLTVGVRRSTDDIYGETSGLLASGEALTGGIKSSATTWTVSLDYQFNWGLLYGKVSRGYKNGGFSPVSVNPDNFTYKPEFVTSYELGLKSDFVLGDVPLRLNAATYYTDYTDLQKTGSDLVPAAGFPDIGGATFNAGEAWISGFEMDMTVQPFSGFRLMANYAYTDAAYEEFELMHKGILAKLDCSGERQPSGSLLDLSCLPYQSVPQHQYSVSARYRLPLPVEIGDVEISATYSWVDEQYTAATSRPSDEPGAWLDDFDLINASLAWYHIMGSNFDLQFFVTNLEDKEYRMSNSNVWRDVYYQSSIWGEPRMYGARLSYSWGE